MGRVNSLGDPYTQRANLLVAPLELAGSSWTSNGMTVTPQSVGGRFLLANASADAELYQSFTADQAGPICLSVSGLAGTLRHLRPYLYDVTAGRQLSDGYDTQQLRSDVWRRVFCRGEVPAAGHVIRNVFRIGRGYSIDVGDVYATLPALEWGEAPSPRDLLIPDADEVRTMLYLRSEDSRPQTHRRRENDNLRTLTATLQDRYGAAVDLTGATVTFRLTQADDGTAVVAAGACVVTSAAAGECYYQFASGDVDAPGIFHGRFIRTVAGKSEAFPADDSLVIEILDSD